MNFKAKTEEQIRSAMLLPKGEYQFEVLSAEDTTSKKSGAEMIKVNLGIYNGEAIAARVFDYLMPAMEAKLRHFCDCTGLLAQYQAGTLCAEDCKGRTGRCKLAVEVDETGKYEDKNAVKDYVCRAAKPLAAAASIQLPGSLPEDDDVPF